MCLKPDRKAALAAKFNLPADASDDDVIDNMERAYDGGDDAFNQVATRAETAEKQVTALSAAKEAADKEVLRLTAAVDGEKARVLELSAAAPKAPDAVTLGMYLDNVAAKREAAVASGAVSEAQARGLDALMADAQGQPTPLALSAAGPARRPLAFAVWDWVASLSASGVRTGNAVPRGTPTQPPRYGNLPPLSGAGAAKEQQDAPPDINRVNQLRQQQGLEPLKELRAAVAPAGAA